MAPWVRTPYGTVIQLKQMYFYIKYPKNKLNYPFYQIIQNQCSLREPCYIFALRAIVYGKLNKYIISYS